MCNNAIVWSSSSIHPIERSFQPTPLPTLKVRDDLDRLGKVFVDPTEDLPRPTAGQLSLFCAHRPAVGGAALMMMIITVTVIVLVTLIKYPTGPARARQDA